MPDRIGTATAAEARPVSLRRALARGLAGGAIAGAAAGLIDGIWSWRALAQFLDAFSSKLRLLVFAAGCYAAAGAVVAGAVAVVAAALLRWTRLGDLVRATARAHREARARDPAQAMLGLSLAVAGVPVLAATLAGSYALAYRFLFFRRAPGLVVAVAMGIGIVALVAGVILAVACARGLEALLSRAAARPSVGRVLSSPRAAWLAAVVALATCVGAAAYKTRHILALLHLRAEVIAIVWAALLPASIRAAAGVTRGLAHARVAVRRVAVGAVAIVIAAAVLDGGAAASVREAGDAYTGLTGAITRTLRWAVDFDRDGYSPILGGGDCDDFNAEVHPGAVEIPDDGIDENCVGGDPTTKPRPLSARDFVPVPPSVPKNTDIILLTIDTTRADQFGVYGQKRNVTPHIDALARDGTLFVDGWAHAPSTRYSMPAIMTGRYPLNVYYDFSHPGWPGLSLKNTTIAEIMKSRGFYTGGIACLWYFGRDRHWDQGFDHYDNSDARLHKSIPGKGPAESTGTSSRQQADKAIAFVDAHQGQRFFLWVHFYDPHARYMKHPGVHDWGNRPIDRYDNELRFTDNQIGRLLAELKRLRLYRRTIIVVTADHGEGFGEHGVWHHGYHLYSAQTKVPFIIRVPGTKPQKLTTPVGHVDILPTLANLAGAKPTQQMMGRSLVNVITGEAPGDRDGWVFQQLSYENHHEFRAAASQHCHVIYNISPDLSWELYRVDIDPMEKHDIIDHPGICAGARAALEKWYDQSQIPADAGAALLHGKPALSGPPLDVDFGDEVRLLSVALPKTPLRPGQAFKVTYTFEARGTLPPGWKVFVHFQGNHGGYFLGDHKPTRPFSWWKAGQYIRYTKTVTIPRRMPAGVYKVWVGIFHKSKRRPARSSRVRVVQDRALVGTIQVVR